MRSALLLDPRLVTVANPQSLTPPGRLKGGLLGQVPP